MPMANKPFAVATILLLTAFAAAQSTTPNVRPRASDLGLKVGILPTGPLDAITDVAGVEVGQATIIRGDNIRTGVTVVLPHSGNLYREKVPGAIFVGNGFGKLAGSTQVDEMGDMETPILLTSTSSVPRAADALIAYMLALPGNENVLSINPVVGETNDGYLSDIRARHITSDDVFAALKNAKGGPVEEGDVGAGTGSSASNGSGDYAIAFSTAPQVRIHANDKALTRSVELMSNDAMSPLFLAAIAATEEAVYNSMFKATTMTGNGHTVEALPIEKTVEILKEHRVIN